MISFTITGNADDPKGNPLPKLKMTGRQHWTPGARRYVRWKRHVVVSFIEALAKLDQSLARDAARNYAAVGRPLVLGGRHARMDIVITWNGGVHGDPENIFGSIADSLFHNDKFLSGSFTYRDESGPGQVEVNISISEQRTCKTSKQGRANTAPTTRKGK